MIMSNSTFTYILGLAAGVSLMNAAHQFDADAALWTTLAYTGMFLMYSLFAYAVIKRK